MSIRRGGTHTGLDSSGYTQTLVTGIQPGVIVVGGTSFQPSTGIDARWQTASLSGEGSGSNSGVCVDLWAPAADIVVAGNQAANQYLKLSGTSFAAPIVAGMVARYLEDHPSATPQTVSQAWAWLNDKATVFDQWQQPLVKNSTTPDAWGTPGPVGLVHHPKETCRIRPASLP
jgi:subtilisin family serine protease